MKTLIVAALVFLAIVGVVLQILGKVMAKSKIKAKNSLILIVLFIIFIVLLIIVVVLVNITKHGADDQNMDEIIEKTSSILFDARRLLDQNTIVELYWPDVIKSINLISKETLYAHNDFIDDIEFKTLNWDVTDLYGNTTTRMIDDCELEQHWMNDLLANTPVKCGMKTSMTNKQLREHFETIKSIMMPTMEFLKNVENELNKMKNVMLGIAEEQKKLDFGKITTENGIMTMKSMVEHLQADINKSETTKQEFHEKMRELATFWITENIVKILVNVVCIILIIMSLISIIPVFRPSIFGQKGPLVLFIINAIITIISCIIILIISIGSVGQFDCPLKNDTFGLSNFTSPLPDPYGNRDLSVCETSESSFFAGILPFITSDDIKRNLRIDEFKEKMLKAPINSPPFNFPSKLSEELEAIRKYWKWFDDLVKTKCAEAPMFFVASFRDHLGNFLKESEKCEENSKAYNENLVGREIHFAERIDLIYGRILFSFERSIGPMNKRIKTIDFGCEPIIGNFSSVGYRICKQFDSPLDTYLIFNIITFIACLVAFILFAISYINSRNLDIKDKDDKSLDPSMSQSVTPTTNIK